IRTRLVLVWWLVGLVNKMDGATIVADLVTCIEVLVNRRPFGDGQARCGRSAIHRSVVEFIPLEDSVRQRRIQQRLDVGKIIRQMRVVFPRVAVHSGDYEFSERRLSAVSKRTKRLARAKFRVKLGVFGSQQPVAVGAELNFRYVSLR